VGCWEIDQLKPIQSNKKENNNLLAKSRKKTTTGKVISFS
jgi:hypothetical protein